jgi:hypothetical protein
MAITYELVKSVAADLYGSCLKKIPEDTKEPCALHSRRNPTMAPKRFSP